MEERYGEMGCINQKGADPDCHVSCVSTSAFPETDLDTDQKF